MTLNEAADLVELFLQSLDGQEIGDWRIIGGECSSGGFGLCDHASLDLVDWLWDELEISSYRAWMTLEDFSRVPDDFDLPTNFDINPHGRYPKLAIGDPVADHCVVVIKNIVVDLTPRQYDEKLPFPFIWRLVDV